MSPAGPAGLSLENSSFRGDEMSIEHVLAVVPVTEVERARRWYETLFGRTPDNNPMPNLV
jgi:hypothetical protein